MLRIVCSEIGGQESEDYFELFSPLIDLVLDEKAVQGVQKAGVFVPEIQKIVILQVIDFDQSPFVQSVTSLFLNYLWKFQKNPLDTRNHAFVFIQKIHFLDLYFLLP